MMLTNDSEAAADKDKDSCAQSHHNPKRAVTSSPPLPHPSHTPTCAGEVSPPSPVDHSRTMHGMRTSINHPLATASSCQAPMLSHRRTAEAGPASLVDHSLHALARTHGHPTAAAVVGGRGGGGGMAGGAAGTGSSNTSGRAYNYVSRRSPMLLSPPSSSAPSSTDPTASASTGWTDSEDEEPDLAIGQAPVCCNCRQDLHPSSSVVLCRDGRRRYFCASCPSPVKPRPRSRHLLNQGGQRGIPMADLDDEEDDNNNDNNTME